MVYSEFNSKIILIWKKLNSKALLNLPRDLDAYAQRKHIDKGDTDLQVAVLEGHEKLKLINILVRWPNSRKVFHKPFTLCSPCALKNLI